ncbi:MULTISPECIES: hypothetical protein [Vibrio]|uniref:Uncharacterized protein n=1 Tax=Vibrio aestuarianus TaxID=28171 RepID=A0A9X4ERE5_9VIBR|nr:MULTISPECIES: hypothetical protein [Vibrio]MBD1563998.1 hypothetical protein [Vibrio sp. S12_S33]MDE1240841.1 hypothetical protein [Vibrio aestuarianus]
MSIYAIVMKQIKRLSKPACNFLIKKGINESTNVQAQDGMVKKTEHSKGIYEDDEYVYHQISDQVINGYLEKKGEEQHKRCAKTGLCEQMTFVSEVEATKAEETINKESCSYSELLSLEKERDQYLERLSVLLAEEEEYAELIQRFPHTEDLLQPIIANANYRSATVLGKINALTSALEVLQTTENTICE